jgi:hexosaminidase
LEVYDYRPFGFTANPLKPEERKSILGMQAQIWAETIISEELLEADLMPRLLAFCERAWNPDVSEADVAKNWPGFAEYIGDVAIPNLEAANFRFHIPKPGAVDEGGKLKALVPYPGLAICYTVDGSDPIAGSPVYDPAAPPAFDAKMKLRTITKSGKMSATVSLKEN